MRTLIDSDGDRTLSPAQARRFYDRLGSWLDTQRFYEDRAVSALVARSRFEAAQSVFELGCGTGRLAARLLANVLSAGSRYTAVDVSATMVRLTTERLRPWAGRVNVRLTGGSARSGEPDACHDRFVATYVLDLLSDRAIRDVLAEAHRILTDDGLLCVVTLTSGSRGFARLVTAAWTWLQRRNPLLVGGCRPLHAADYLSGGCWGVEYPQTIVAFGVSSEIVVAAKRGRRVNS
jgi:ubiquinone/menaquinone biosynthesis C-methylase UbiE